MAPSELVPLTFPVSLFVLSFENWLFVVPNPIELTMMLVVKLMGYMEYAYVM